MENLNTVITVSGKQIGKKLCVKIGGEFYEKGIDCYSIDNKWYRKGNPRIYFNILENQWIKITKETSNGIISYFDYDGSFTFGNFEKSFENSYLIDTNYGQHYVASKELFDRIPKVWDNGTGRYYDLKRAASRGFNPLESPKGTSYIYQFERVYNAESMIPLFSTIDHSKYSKDLLGEINKSNKTFELFDKYSFGLEIETSGGILPEHRCKELGLIPLKDGSIKGHEYTTIPMKGASGINLLMNQFKEIKSLCSFNKECSIHVHFGNFELNKDKVLRLYNIAFALQNEIGEMFPQWIFNTAKYKGGGKDYCKKLPQTFESIDELYYFLSEHNTDWNGDFTRNHPQDPNRAQKWNNHQRYYWLNIINLLFGANAKTAEFRIHTPTFNYTKIINWMFICTSILNYSENFDGCIDFAKIKLNNVVDFSLDEVSAKIVNDYISTRKSYFKECLEIYNDSYGVLDLIQDCDIEFKTPYHTNAIPILIHG